LYISSESTNTLIACGEGNDTVNVFKGFSQTPKGLQFSSCENIQYYSPSGKFIIWQNADNGELQWWSLSGGGPIASEEWEMGRGAVGSIRVNGDWRFAGTTTVGGYRTLFYQNVNEGQVKFLKLDDSARQVAVGYVSETIRVNGNWRAVGASQINGVPTIIWQNQSSGSVAYWRIGDDGKLVNENKNDGWGFVAEYVTVNSSWRLAGITELGGVKTLIWQNQSSGMVAFWRLNEQTMLRNRNKDDGWGWVAETEHVDSLWRLVGISRGNTLIWQNQGSGKVAWWRLNEQSKLPNANKNDGWGWVAENISVDSAWYLGDITEPDGTKTLIWHNQNNGKAAYWRLNDSTQILNENRYSGWGYVSEGLTVSGGWRMNCVTR